MAALQDTVDLERVAALVPFDNSYINDTNSRSLIISGDCISGAQAARVAVQLTDISVTSPCDPSEELFSISLDINEVSDGLVSINISFLKNMVSTGSIFEFTRTVIKDTGGPLAFSLPISLTESLGAIAIGEVPGAVLFKATFTPPGGGVAIGPLESSTISIPVTSLSVGATYSVAVSAFDAAGNETVSSNTGMFAKIAPPDPLLFTATAVSNSQINLSWTSGGDPTAAFLISYQAGASAPANCSSGTSIASSAISGTSHSVTGLGLLTQYSFRVCSVNRDDTPVISSGITAGATTFSGVPGAFSISSATNGNTQSVVTWGAASGATSYTVTYGTSSGSYGTTVSTVATSPTTITGLSNGTTYYIMVTAVNASGSTNASAQVTATPAGPPGAFSISSATNGNTQSVVTWGAASGATSYTVKYGTSSGSYGTTVSTGATSPTTITGLSNGTTYYIMVTALNASGLTNASADLTATPAGVADPWAAISTTALPSDPPQGFPVWTGTQMLLFGSNGSVSRYNPTGNTWSVDATTGDSPGARFGPNVIWTGTKMWVWGGSTTSGGYPNTGGLYDPVTKNWTETSIDVGIPTIANDLCTPVWTGAKIIVWGTGCDPGGIYDPSDNTWKAISKSAYASPDGATSSNIMGYYQTAVWTGTKMLVFGGLSGSGGAGNAGATYDPDTDTWASISQGTNVPEERNFMYFSRRGSGGVWTGTHLIVWGGISKDYSPLGDGASYSPATDTWSTISSVEAPSARERHSVVWTGSEMIVWGGYNSSGDEISSGALYNPSTDTWRPMSTGANAPGAGGDVGAVWTGSEMILWNGSTSLARGRYTP